VLARERTSDERMRAEGSGIELRVRLTDRKRFGDAYVDNGYMRTILTARNEAARLITSKFILVMAKQPNGRYALVTNADTDAPADACESAKPVAGLKFDE
jgi:hypothetical protein